MPGQYQNGFSLENYNKQKKMDTRRANIQQEKDDAASQKANDHLMTLASGKMVTLSLDKDFLVIKFLKNLVRGDSRYYWNQNKEAIHFSARKPIISGKII